MKEKQTSSPLAILIFIFLTILAGCKVEDKTWIDRMISEMESAWIQAHEAGLGQQGRNAATTAVAQRYFRPGMTKDDAFNLLRELKIHGFEVGEYRYEGARNWPDGELRPYTDEATRRNLQNQYPKGTIEIVATKRYDSERVIVDKHVAVSFRLSEGVSTIGDVKARLWASSI